MNRYIQKVLSGLLKKSSPNPLLSAIVDDVLTNAYRNGEIAVVYDIGANSGSWSGAMKKRFGNSEFYLFEANPVHEPEIKKTGFPYWIEALSNGDGEGVFYSINGTGDSLYKENTECYDDCVERKVSTRSLGGMVREFGIPLPDLVKMDVQGAELDVIQGGQSVFDYVRYVLSELPVAKYNIGAPGFSEYMNVFAGHGLRPVEVAEIHKRKGEVVQLDILFRRY